MVNVHHVSGSHFFRRKRIIHKNWAPSVLQHCDLITIHIQQVICELTLFLYMKGKYSVYEYTNQWFYSYYQFPQECEGMSTVC